ncbi:helix-turn-helix domain-containing protein [Umezawaea endophytica]|uniref:Helix-turn-helix domain-containing protein n=1 Tax=Umezawaea endophytica TaxID=1654476 RepID=A0A9X3AHD4_9PSEU|nr:helix-turn-helix transcriptional regulator [Umezawaea endophytica]MCS7481337.1 helix-turn-helix domain-containing protein [Umezawaea endophytica]
MGERRSTTRSQVLGAELARIRKTAGLDAKVVAEKLGWAGSKLSRIEQGKQGVEDIELLALLTVCDALGDNMVRLLDLNRESGQDTWLHMFGKGPGGRTRALTTELQRATTIINYECSLIPGLIQTEGYIRALTTVDQDELVDQRKARQEVLRGARAPLATFLIEESALRRPIGGPAVIHDQLMHLAFLAEWKRVSIRVLPTSAGMHAGVDGSFLLLDNKERKPLVVVGIKTANVYLERREQVAKYVRSAEELVGRALSPEHSRRFIARLADDPDLAG